MALNARTSRSGAIDAREPDAGHLRGGMHAGVGAAGPGDVHRRAFDGGEHRLELALHRALPGLALPAGEVRAVVRHDEAQRADAGGSPSAS